MAESELRTIINNTKALERKIVAGDESNETTMMYYAELAKYYYHGGKAKLYSKLNKSGILDSGILKNNERARLNYYKNTQLYIKAGKFKLMIHEILSKYTKLNKNTLETVLDKLNSKCKYEGIQFLLYKPFMNIEIRYNNDYYGYIKQELAFSEDDTIRMIEDGLCDRFVKLVMNNKNIRIERKFYDILE